MEYIEPPPPDAGVIRERHARILERLRAAAARGGHDPGRVRIVAVTKTWPLEIARAAADAGLRLLGESRVQEAEPKVAAIPEVEWHLVGRLQSNKARRAVRAFSAIHSVDSLDLLARLDAMAVEEGRQPALMLQVNLTGSATTAGATEEDVEADAFVARLGSLEAARVVGLMTIARNGAEHAEAHATFGRLRELRERLQLRVGSPLPELSMGMSADAEAAAEAGATLVRIGTALFGSRG